MDRQGDRNLVFGILALQLGFVSRDQLVAVASAWMHDTSKSLSHMLLAQGALQEDTYSLLETLVEKHLQLHGNDPERSLAALEDVSDCRDCLAELKTGELRTGEQRSPSGAEVTGDFAPSKASGVPLGADVTVDRGPPATEPRWESTVQSAGPRELPGGRFRVLRPHAKGGLGKVSVALDEELHREVAFKELLERRATDPVARARLLLEAEITGSLEHPGVVPVYGLGQHADGRPFYAMRFIKGETLRAAITQYHTELRGHSGALHRSLRLRRLLSHFLATCNVIEYAHNRGIIHRDLKPENVMLGKYGETLVVDWGLAKAVDASEPGGLANSEAYRPQRTADVAATQLGSVIGTPAFMSPEQARGQVDQISLATDIYSLGATLYSLLTNCQPFEGDNLLDVVTRVRQGEFPRPRDVNRAVPAALEAVCLKAMAAEPLDRYASAAALGDDVEHWLADEPVAAHRENVWQRFARWTRRHRAWTQAGAASLVLVAVVLGAATFLVNRARQTAIVLADKNEVLAEQELVAKREAVTRLGEARQAVDTWLTGMSDALQFYPGMQEARRRLLQKAVEQYQQFAGQPSDDPELQLERGRASLRLGDVHRLLNDSESALQAYRRALDLFEGLRSDPSLAAEALAAEANVEWANSQNRLGLVLADTGEHAPADVAYRAAFERLQQIPEEAKEKNGSNGYSETLASVLTNWGTLSLARGQPAEAARQLNQARQLFEELVQHASKEPRHRASLASLQTILARLDMSAGRYQEANVNWEAALSVLDELVRQSPDQPAYLETRASTRLHAAGLLRLMGKYEEELKAYRAVIADYETLQEALPDVPAYRESMALTRTDLGQALHELGRNPTALEELDRASPVLNQLALEYPTVPRYYEAQAACRDILAQVLLDLDKPQEAKARAEAATEAYQRLANSYVDVPEYRERLAVSQSHLGQSQHRLRDTAARQSLEDAIQTLNDLIEQNSENPVYRSEKAHVLQHLGLWYFDSGDSMQAEKTYAEASTLWKNLADQATPEHLSLFCRLLLLCPVEPCRDSQQALQLAERLEQLVPQNTSYAALHGVALYRAGQWELAFDTLQRAAARRGFDDPEDWFFISMTQARLQRLEDARVSFERACRSLEKSAPGSVDLARLRKEAEPLLQGL